MKKKSVFIVMLFMVVWTFVSIIAVTWGTRFDWLDNVHIDYGFPFVWSTQTLSTIVGAVNLWTFDATALVMNLVLWLGIMLIVTSILLYYFNRRLF
jgi:hypothetical protein